MAEHDPDRDARSQPGGERGDVRDPHRDPVELPGGGVLHRSREEVDVELPVGFQDLVRPFLLMGLSALGVIPHPDTGRSEVDLVAARAAIGTLELLRDKTEGRLESGEARLLEESLLDLKMQYVEARRQVEGE
jgi:hypothetical protein